MKTSNGGFTLIEVLTSMLFLSVAVVGMGTLFTAYNHSFLQHSARVGVEENLRIGIDMVSDALRNANHRVPKSNLSSWITWVPSFTTNPKITVDADGNATLSIASATSQPVATVNTHINAGATSVVLSATTNLNTTSKSLIVIGDSEYALVTSVSGTTINIDTDPTVAGAQGSSRQYPDNTPVYRVDVTTFSIAADGTGVSQLLRNLNQGAGTEAVVEGINVFTVATLIAGQQYRVTLTGRSAKLDPVTHEYLEESLNSAITMAN